VGLEGRLDEFISLAGKIARGERLANSPKVAFFGSEGFGGRGWFCLFCPFSINHASQSRGTRYAAARVGDNKIAGFAIRGGCPRRFLACPAIDVCPLSVRG